MHATNGTHDHQQIKQQNNKSKQQRIKVERCKKLNRKKKNCSVLNRANNCYKIIHRVPWQMALKRTQLNTIQ